jgi:hypothetical protein
MLNQKTPGDDFRGLAIAELHSVNRFGQKKMFS